MRSKRVAWSTLTKSASQALSSSLTACSSALGVSTCFLQYSITFARILLVTFGNGIALSIMGLITCNSSIMGLITSNSIAATTSRPKSSPSELLRVIIFEEAMIRDLVRNPKPRSLKRVNWYKLMKLIGSPLRC